MDGGGTDLDRLRERALREQWSVEELDWRAIDLSPLPEPIRQAGADAFAQLQYGEHIAHIAATRLLSYLDGPARAFCETQVHDEARHAQFFSQGIEALACTGRVRDSVKTLMHDVETASSPEQLVLGMQILIEGAAHSIFSEAGRIFSHVDDNDDLLRAPKLLVGEWIPKLLARDESRHIAFGLAFLRERVPALSRSARHGLEESLQRWGAIVIESCADPDIVDGVGVESGAMCRVLIDDLNLRIRQTGLETRL